MISEKEVATLIRALTENASRLGLTWAVRMATVVQPRLEGHTNPIGIIFDGDANDVTVDNEITNVTGVQLVAGERVYTIVVPPSGVYIFGVAGDLMPPAKGDTQSGNISGFSGTAFQTGATICGTTFIAPRSGRVFIHWATLIETNGATDYAALSVRVRRGDVLASGTNILSPDTDRAITGGTGAGLLSRIHAGRTHLLSGLTPGDTYNVVTEHAMSGATDTGDIFYRQVFIAPTW